MHPYSLFSMRNGPSEYSIPESQKNQPEKAVDQVKLSETQQAVLDQVLTILREDVNLNQKVQDAFQQNLNHLVSDGKRLDFILETLQDTKARELEAIMKEFSEGRLDAQAAKEQSRGVILRYTELQLGMVRANAEFLRDSHEEGADDGE